jgi:hypothetical protein
MERVPMWEPFQFGGTDLPARHRALESLASDLCRVFRIRHGDSKILTEMLSSCNDSRWSAYQAWASSLPPLPTEACFEGREVVALTPLAPLENNGPPQPHQSRG